MQTDLEPDEIVELGARWLVGNRDQIDAGVIDHLKKRFGATALEAIEMVRRANAIRATCYPRETPGGVHAPGK